MKNKILIFFIFIFISLLFTQTNAHALELFKRFWKGIDWDNDGQTELDKDAENQKQGASADSIKDKPDTQMAPNISAGEVQFRDFQIEAKHKFYVDALKGNDNNPGTSPEKPWQSLDKVNKAKIPPSSIVHLKKGQIFRGYFYAARDVMYTSYGTGDKPKLWGSMPKNNPADWQEVGKNLWQCQDKIYFGMDVGNIIFDHGQATATKVFDDTKLRRDLDFYYDKKNRSITLYSQKNPGQRWNNIEVALGMGIIGIKQVQNVILNDLNLQYTGGHAINIEESENIKIQNLDISYIGGTNLFSIIGRKGVKRFGNGIEIYGTGKNILIENNTIDQVYDAGLTNQSYEKKGVQDTIVYRNNTVNNSEYCFEIWFYEPRSQMKNVLFENNVCKNTGKGWGHEQRPDGKNARNIMVFGNTAKTDNIIIRKNKFHKATESHIRFADPGDEKEFKIYENNLED